MGKVGVAQIKASKTGLVNEIGMITMYGHTTMSVTLSIQYSIAPVSLSFSGYVKELGESYDYKEVKNTNQYE